MSHKHYCGHTDAESVANGEPKAAEGCGTIWSHERFDIFEEYFINQKTHKQLEAMNEEMHMCPNCGKGPWYLIYRGKRETENDAQKASQ